MEALEIIWMANRGLQLAFDLAEKVNRGEMSKAEAEAAWKLQVAEIKIEEARFDRLTN